MFEAEQLDRQLRQGNVAAAAEALLNAAAEERSWLRAESLAAVPRIAGPEPLLPELEAALRDGNDPGRRNAARAVFAALGGTRGSEAARRHLEQLATRDADPDVRVLAASALGETANPAALPALVRVLRDRDANVAAAAADALGNLGAAAGVRPLTALLGEGDPWRAAAAAVALGRLAHAGALPALRAALLDPVVGAVAAEAIGEIRDVAGLEALRPALQAEEQTLRRTALDAAASILGAHPQPPAWLRPLAAAETAWLNTRWQATADPAAALLLGVAGTADAARLLLQCAAETPEQTPSIAAALALLPDDVALAILLPHLERAARALEEHAPRSEPKTPPPGAAHLPALLAALPPLRNRDEAERVSRLLSSGHGELRAVAAEVLARAQPEAQVRGIVTELLAEPHRRVGAVLTLARLPAGACDLLTDLLDDGDVEVRCAAADGIARCPAPAVAPHIVAALRAETDAAVRDALIAALGAVAGAEAVAELDAVRRHGEPGARFAAVRALGRTHAPAALPHLLNALAGDDPMLQAAALQALGELGDAGGTDALVHHLDHGDRETKRLAAGALSRIAPPAATRRLIAALGDADWRVRLAAARTLARLDAPEAAEPLRTLRETDPEPLVRRAAARATAREG